MSRPIYPLGRAALAAFIAGSLLAACAAPTALSDVRYDLGPLAQTSSPSTLPPLKVLDVSAPAPLDNDAFMYRLGNAPLRTARYANSHWTTSPARLLTQRLRAGLMSHASVLTGADAVPAPVLRVDLEQFEQVFDTETRSSGVVAARATLIQDGKVIGQHTFLSRAPASTPDASGGAHALASASDELVAQIATWVSMQPFVGTP